MITPHEFTLGRLCTRRVVSGQEVVATASWRKHNLATEKGGGVQFDETQSSRLKWKVDALSRSMSAFSEKSSTCTMLWSFSFSCDVDRTIQLHSAPLHPDDFRVLLKLSKEHLLTQELYTRTAQLGCETLRRVACIQFVAA